jgi:hypothetical protein
MGAFDRFIRINEEMDEEKGRCPDCGLLLSTVYPNEDSDEGKYQVCKNDACKQYLKVREIK